MGKFSPFIRALSVWLLGVVFLLSCTAKTPSTLPISAPKPFPGSAWPSLLPQETFFSSRQLNPSELALTGFRVQDLPLADGCSDGCLTNFNADLKWPAPAWQPQGATITLATFQEPTTAPASFYNYYFNVLETALNAQGIPFATKVRMDVGLHVLDTQVTNQRSTGVLSLILNSTDGYNFNLDAPGSGNGHMTYNWGKANTTSFCEAGGSGNAIAMPATSAALTLNPTTQVGHLIAQYEGPMIYDYYNTYLPGNPYSCAYIGNQVGPASANLDVSFSVRFAPKPTPSPTPNPSSTPTPTPTPNGSATPSPIPTLLPPGPDLNCPPQISNEVDRLMRELERLQASIPGAPPLTGDTQGFSVKAAPLAYPVAMGLVYLGTNYPRVHNFVQGALRATLSSLANKTSELDQARAKKAAKDAEFAEAVKNGDSASFQRLRAESNELQNEILRLEAEQRQLEQAKHNHEQNLQKLDQLGQNVAGVQASAQDNCNTPNPSPSPSGSPTPSLYPTAAPGSYPSSFDGKGASQVPELSGKALDDAEKIMRRHGFSERRETAGNQGRQYYEYKHPDKSRIWIENSPATETHGRVNRLPEKANKSEGYRYNPDGTIRDRPAGHDTGERVVIP